MSKNTFYQTIGAVGLVLLVACNDASTSTSADATVHAAALNSVYDTPWSAPVWLGPNVNSTANEQNAILSRDGLSLFFVSDRAGGAGILDIYVSQRSSVDDPWGAPVNLVAINTPSADFAPNLSPDGHLLFFTSNRPGGAGNNDIYVSERSNPHDDLSWTPPRPLASEINTADAENAPFFMQSGEAGPINLYFNRGVQAQNRAEFWSAAIELDGTARGPAAFVAELSFVGFNDAALSVRKDGREAFFWSNRPGSLALDIYTAIRLSPHHAWSVPVSVAELNTAAGEVTPHLSHDGLTIVFGSNRAGGLGGNDLWMARR